jgi:hypothetical protein
MVPRPLCDRGVVVSLSHAVLVADRGRPLAEPTAHTSHPAPPRLPTRSPGPVPSTGMGTNCWPVMDWARPMSSRADSGRLELG